MNARQHAKACRNDKAAWREAVRHGRAAGSAGYAHTRNPHAVGSNLRLAWHNGWVEGYAARSMPDRPDLAGFL